MSNRLVRAEEFRWLGDKRTFIVYDQDNCDPEILASIAEAESWQTFGPDTVVEARNRGFRVTEATPPPED